jgi:hypothetical protein
MNIKLIKQTQIMNQNILEQYKEKITPLIAAILNKCKKSFVWAPTFLGDNSDEAKERERVAFEERQIKMKEGDIAQIMIGNWIGFEDLGIGHKTGVDCRKLDNSMILEIKNKHNTCNSGSAKTVCDKLSRYKLENPNTHCIWGIINPKSSVSGDRKVPEHNGVKILKLQGDELFKRIFVLNEYNYTNEVANIVRKLMYGE